MSGVMKRIEVLVAEEDVQKVVDAILETEGVVSMAVLDADLVEGDDETDGPETLKIDPSELGGSDAQSS